ncbi:hypothetical protein Peur_026401 [Populus x canadensis]
MKQAMLFPQPAQAGDAFHQALNRLAQKLPHDTIVYLKSSEKIFNWITGPVGDLKPCLPLSPAKKIGLIKVAISQKV